MCVRPFPQRAFLSREFGRAPNQRVTSDGCSQDVVDESELEQVLLSETIGRPAAGGHDRRAERS